MREIAESINYLDTVSCCTSLYMLVGVKTMDIQYKKLTYAELDEFRVEFYSNPE